MITQKKHIVKAYDAELEQLTNLISEMNRLVQLNLHDALKAIDTRDQKLAQQVVDMDQTVDELEHKIYNFCVNLLALRQPMASDLREILCAFKVSSELERIGDYAENVAKRAYHLIESPVFSQVNVKGILELGKAVEDMVVSGMVAYLEHDLDKAFQVWQSDYKTDELYYTHFRALLAQMINNPQLVECCTNLLFIAKNLERIGDHVTNIAESVNYFITGNTYFKAD